MIPSQEHKLRNPLIAFAPETLNLYDAALWRKDAGEATQKRLPDFSDFALAYSVHGDYSGVVLAGLSKAVLQHYKLERDDLLDFFQESMNVFLGHLLTRMEREQATMCEFQFPNVYQEKKLKVFYNKIAHSADIHRQEQKPAIFMKSQYALEIGDKILPCLMEYFLYPAKRGSA